VDTLKAEQSALKQLAAALADLDQQGLAAKVEAAAAARDAAAAALEAAEHGVEAANRELAGEAPTIATALAHAPCGRKALAHAPCWCKALAHPPCQRDAQTACGWG
jgi:hypothetical protein